MKTILRCLGALLLLAGAAGLPARAQDYPNKPIRLIIGYPPGGGTDIMGRILADAMIPRLGQQIVVENRPGAGSAIGTAYVAKSAPDGYTLLATTGAIVDAPAFQDNVGYDPLRDFASVSLFGAVPLVLVISPDRHINTVQALVEYGKEHPGALNYASGGIGSATHIPMERFRLASGWTGQHIPFKGAPEALTEVMTGRVDIYFAPLPAALPMIKAGRLVPLAVAGSKRTPVLPGVPTTVEAGYPNSDSDFWTGLFAPKQTPRDVIDVLHDEIERAMAQPEIKQKLATFGVEPMPLMPQQIDRLLATEAPTAFTLAKAVGAVPAK